MTMVNTLKKILNKNVEYIKCRGVLNVEIEVSNKMANSPNPKHYLVDAKGKG